MKPSGGVFAQRSLQFIEGNLANRWEAPRDDTPLDRLVSLPRDNDDRVEDGGWVEEEVLVVEI